MKTEGITSMLNLVYRIDWIKSIDLKSSIRVCSKNTYFGEIIEAGK